MPHLTKAILITDQADFYSTGFPWLSLFYFLRKLGQK